MPKPKTKSLSVFAVHYTPKTGALGPSKMDVIAQSPDDARAMFVTKMGKGAALIDKVKFLRLAAEEMSPAPAPHEEAHAYA